MNKLTIIQRIVDKINAQNYLEIGVQYGDCLLNIKAPKKIAVDPDILISGKKKLKTYLLNYTNFFNVYFSEKSDDFFSNNKSFLKENTPDVVLIDGLHTYEQSLKDVYNALKYLNKGGVIIMHDCNPPSEHAATPVDTFDEFLKIKEPDWKREWCGDVWKTIVHLKKHNPDVNVVVLDCDYGVGVVYPKKNFNQNINFSFDESINNLTYNNLYENKEDIINLRPISYFEEILRRVDPSRLKDD